MPFKMLMMIARATIMMMIAKMASRSTRIIECEIEKAGAPLGGAPKLRYYFFLVLLAVGTLTFVCTVSPIACSIAVASCA